MIKYYYLIVLLITFSTELNAQIFENRFEKLTVKQGLPSSNIFEVVQDKKGFLWIGTSKGLVRFDGIGLKMFPIPSEKLFLDNEGILWIKSRKNALVYMDPESFVYHEVENFKLPVTGISQTADGNILLPVIDGNIYKYDKTTGEVKYFVNVGQKIIGNSQVVKENHGATIYVALGSLGLMELDLKTGKKNIIPLPASKDKAMPTIQTILVSDSIVYVAGNSFFKYNSRSKKIYEIPEVSRLIENTGQANNLINDKEGNVWIGTGKGLINYNPANGNIFKFISLDTDSKSLSSDNISSLFLDKSNILWISTIKGGLNKLDLNAKRFKVLMVNKNKSDSPSGNFVSGIYADSKDNVWIVTANKTLTRWIRNEDRLISYNQQSGFKANSDLAFVTGDSLGNIWIGPWLWTLHKATVDGDKVTFKYYNSDNSCDSDKPCGWSYRWILPSRTGKIWIAYADAGLDMLDPENGKFTHYYKNKDDINYYFRNYFWSLYEDKAGNIWAGHSDNGFYILRQQTQKFESYQFPDQATGEVYCFHLSDNGLAYLGTNNGIWTFDLTTKKFINHYTRKDGLVNEDIRGILEDNKQNLWISTDRGLVKFDQKNQKFRTFTEEDGIPGTEFSIGSFSKNKKGEMFFGTDKGLVYFHPDSIKDNPSPAIPVLTELRIYHKPVNVGEEVNGRIVLRKDLAYTENIDLQESDKSFSIVFSGLHFANHEMNNYAYKLEGWDKDWIYPERGEKVAVYNNIPAGDYTFRLKSSNRDYVWSNDEAVLRITIHPPFYNTWWFRALLVLLAILIINLIFQFYTMVLKRQKEMLKKRVKEQTDNINKANQELQVQKEALEVQYQNIRALAEIGQKITSSIRAMEIIESVYQSLNSMMDARDLVIGLYKEDVQELEFYGYSAIDGPIEANTLSISQEDHLSVWCFKNRKPVFIRDVETGIGEYFNKKVETYESNRSPKSLIYMPLVNIDRNILGVLLVKSFSKNAFNDIHFNIVQNLASYISIALDNARVYGQVKEQSEKLIEAGAMKSRFLANISHEFKTPLTLILGPVKSLQHQLNTEENQALLDIMERNALRLQRLIQHLLELSKLEEGAMKLQDDKIDMTGKIAQIARGFSFEADVSEVNFTIKGIEKECWGIIDEEKLEEILYNLLSNAFKYTKAKVSHNVEFVPEVELEVLTIERNLVIKVKDNGIGFPESEKERIFNRFYRIENNQRQTEGIGIGLSLTQKLVEFMGGKIEVESTESIGTTFSITLPFIPAKNPAIAVETTLAEVKRPEKNKEGKKINTSLSKILIVEDNDDLRKYLKILLENEYEVSEAENGLKGFEQAVEELPEMVISDVMMPLSDGYELCRKIKSDKRTSHIPVILLTAKNAIEAVIEGFDTGADDYVTKPFDKDVLLSRMKSLLRNRKKLIAKFNNEKEIASAEAAKAASDDKFLHHAIEIIEQNLSNTSFNVDMLAQASGMSRTQFFKKFNAVAGMQPNDYIRQYRLKRAAYLFNQGRADIAQVSYEVGFEYPNYFSRCFKEEFGKSPSDFIHKN